MIVCVLARSQDYPQIQAMEWAKHFSILTEDQFESIGYAVYVNKPKLYDWLRTNFKNVLILGTTLIEPQLLSQTDLLLSYNIEPDFYEKNNMGHLYTTQVLDYNTNLWLINHFKLKGDVGMSIEDSLKKAMRDLGLSNTPTEKAFTPTETPQESIPEPPPVGEVPEPHVETTTKPTSQLDFYGDITTEIPEIKVETKSIEPESTPISIEIPKIGAISDSPVSPIITPTSKPVNRESEKLKYTPSSTPVNSYITRKTLDTAMPKLQSLVYFRQTETGLECWLNPKYIQISDKVIDGTTYKVLRFINQMSSPTEVKSPPPKPVSSDTSLEELVREKQRLDAAIATARKSNNEAEVNELRKQRRTIRTKIRNWGG